MKPWTAEHERILREHAAQGIEACMRLLPGRTEGAIRAHASSLHVRLRRKPRGKGVSIAQLAARAKPATKISMAGVPIPDFQPLQAGAPPACYRPGAFDYRAIPSLVATAKAGK